MCSLYCFCFHVTILFILLANTFLVLYICKICLFKIESWFSQNMVWSFITFMSFVFVKSKMESRRCCRSSTEMWALNIFFLYLFIIYAKMALIKSWLVFFLKVGWITFCQENWWEQQKIMEQIVFVKFFFSFLKDVGCPCY